MRKPWSRRSVQGLAVALLAGAVAWAGCSGENTVTDPPDPETGPALVSDPVAFGEAELVPDGLGDGDLTFGCDGCGWHALPLDQFLTLM